MKVAVITRHAIINYGSILQALATQEIVESLGHNCEIIDYVREDEHYSKTEETILKRKSDWCNNWLKKHFYLAVRQPGTMIAGKKFEKAQRDYLNLTRRYSSKSELRANKPQADVYMTGSDQVWGPVADGSYDSSYCLSFIDDADKKISFASSLGHTEMSEELMKYYVKWLSRYNQMAVREDSAVEMLYGLGFEAQQVLDPTLLIDSKGWEKYLEPIPEKRYVLVYQLHNNPKLNEYAKRAAKEMKLPLVRVSPTLHHFNRGGKFVWTPSLGQFLSYIKNAECIITDSFHGTAFAINFNTSFVEILPNNKTETRNMSILKLIHLTNRILVDKNDLELAKCKVDFSYANEILKEKRKQSINILETMIEN